MIKRAVILAIGSQNHRSVLTYNRAHAMLPALGKPLVTRIMDRLYRTGIRDYTIVVGENEGAVASYLNTQWVPDAKIEFILQSESTSFKRTFADIVRKYPEPFIFCSYNSFTHNRFPESLLKHYNESNTDLLFSGSMTTLSKAQNHYYAIMDNQNVKEIALAPSNDHPYFTLTNLAICGQGFIDHISKRDHTNTGRFNWQFMDIANHYLQNGGRAMLTEAAWVLQIETDRDLLTLNRHLLEEGQDAHILSELPYTVQVIPPVRIDPQVNVGQGAKIGPNVYLERGSSVGHDVVLHNAIILERGTVPSEKTLFDTIISTRGPIP